MRQVRVVSNRTEQGLSGGGTGMGVNVRLEREGIDAVNVNRELNCHLCRLRPKGERIHLRQYAPELPAQDGDRHLSPILRGVWLYIGLYDV